MNLEKIDTSTTAGKAEVMRLAAEGRRVATRAIGNKQWYETEFPAWSWNEDEYGVIADPVGPEEVFVVVRPDGYTVAVYSKDDDANGWDFERDGVRVTRYIRADLAGEKG